MYNAMFCSFEFISYLRESALIDFFEEVTRNVDVATRDSRICNSRWDSKLWSAVNQDRDSTRKEEIKGPKPHTVSTQLKDQECIHPNWCDLHSQQGL